MNRVLGTAGVAVSGAFLVVLGAGPASAAPPYANCSEAEADGRTDIPRGDPAYSSNLDRNNDGVACESDSGSSGGSSSGSSDSDSSSSSGSSDSGSSSSDSSSSGSSESGSGGSSGSVTVNSGSGGQADATSLALPAAVGGIGLAFVGGSVIAIRRRSVADSRR